MRHATDASDSVLLSPPELTRAILCCRILATWHTRDARYEELEQYIREDRRESPSH